VTRPSATHVWTTAIGGEFTFWMTRTRRAHTARPCAHLLLLCAVCGSRTAVSSRRCALLSPPSARAVVCGWLCHSVEPQFGRSAHDTKHHATLTTCSASHRLHRDVTSRSFSCLCACFSSSSPSTPITVRADRGQSHFRRMRRTMNLRLRQLTRASMYVISGLRRRSLRSIGCIQLFPMQPYSPRVPCGLLILDRSRTSFTHQPLRRFDSEHQQQPPSMPRQCGTTNESTAPATRRYESGSSLRSMVDLVAHPLATRPRLGAFTLK
jgi:hypothetical protein